MFRDAMLAADFVRERIVRSGAPLRRFKVAVFSGIFHHLASSERMRADETDPFSEQMRRVYAFANMSLPPSCRARHPAEPSTCILGLHPLEAMPSAKR